MEKLNFLKNYWSYVITGLYFIGISIIQLIVDENPERAQIAMGGNIAAMFGVWLGIYLAKKIYSFFRPKHEETNK
ncbi:MAG: hypothetical protein AABY40_03375 [Nanoarchaeota archaeon]